MLDNRGFRHDAKAAGMTRGSGHDARENKGNLGVMLGKIKGNQT